MAVCRLTMTVPGLILCQLILASGALAASADWSSRRTEHFLYEFHPQQEQVAERLAASDRAVRQRQCRLIAPCFTDVITVKIASDEAEFLSLLPWPAHIDWAAGVAYAQHDLIVLRVDKTMLLSIEETFEHEVSHIALLKAVPGHPPRWFTEGLAILLAEHNLVERFEKVAAATVSDSTLTLNDIDDAFASGDSLRELAYAQSGMLVASLEARYEAEGVREFVKALSWGMPFDDAFARVFRISTAGFFDEWADSVSRLGWVYSLTGDWMLWLAVSVLIIVAVMLRGLRGRRRKAAMDKDSGPDWEFRTPRN